MTASVSLWKTLVLSLLLVIAGVLYGVNANSNAYSSGYSDAISDVNAAHHGSPAKSDAGDVSTMWAFHHKECDKSHNLRDARSVAYNAGATEWRVAVDGNGAFAGCNTNSLPFKGKAHVSCAGDFTGCGRHSVH